MGGVVYSGQGNGSLGKMGGAPIVLAAGDEIPPGVYFTDAAWSAMVGGTLTTMPPGIVESDGQATSAGGNLFRIGAAPDPVWPWPDPWPIGQPWFP